MSTNHNFWRERRAEADSNWRPSAYHSAKRRLTSIKWPASSLRYCMEGGGGGGGGVHVLGAFGVGAVAASSGRLFQSTVVRGKKEKFLQEKTGSSDCGFSAVMVSIGCKLQALVYDILPSRMKVPESDARSVYRLHTPSIAFWHLPPNSARFSYATEGALFISAQLSTDAVSERFGYW